MDTLSQPPTPAELERAGLRIRRVPVADLHVDPANARAHDDRNLEAITASLRRFGQAEPLVVQAGTGRVIGGNGRLAAMRGLAWTECDVVELTVENLEATALGIALNRTAELATWDERALAQLLGELQAEDELLGVGFSETDIEELLAGLPNEIDLDVKEGEVPEPPADPTTRRGDLWVLGRHRLLCGDSASWDDVERLLGGVQIHLLNMDPPYGVRVEPRSNNAIAAGLSSFKQTHHQKLDLARHPEKAKPTSQMRPRDRPLQNDFVSDDDFKHMLRSWFGNAAKALLPGRGFYIWGGYANLGNYPPALKECGLYYSQGIVWDKQHPVLTRKDFMGSFELAFYGWKEGAAHEFFGPNNARDLWAIKKVNPQAMSHLTEKPVELAARAIQYSSRKDENVLDLFGGSGSTMAACEQLERSAFLMELDEPYADVIVQRWERLSGREAVLEGDGRSFKEVRESRAAEAPNGG